MEIKINLRSVRDNKTEPFSVSKLRAPNIGCTAASLSREEFKSQALAAALKGECSDKVPHFMVRDIRDTSNKGKLQTPIHQVRDVRKLVKSSYHFVSLDNNDNKSTVSAADSHPEPKKQMPYRNSTSVSPIVIKCQSVNTNNNGKQPENLSDFTKREVFDTDRSSSPEGAKSAPVQKAVGRAPIGTSYTSEGGNGLKSESRLGSRRPSDITDKKAEPKMANQVAFEKLQAAVKTMEQLYVFEKNEWKRKNEPHPMTDSHVLSMITSEEQGGAEEERGGSSVDKNFKREAEKTPPAGAMSPSADKDHHAKVFQSLSSHDEKFLVRSVNAASTGSRNISSSLKTSANTSIKTPQSSSVTAPFSPRTFTPMSPKLPVSLKIRQTKAGGFEGVESKEEERSSTSADHENYLTIPVKSQQTSKQASSADRTSVYTFPPAGPVGPATRGPEDSHQSPKRSSIVMETRSSETPSAAIYHTVPLSASHPQVYCFSPAVTPAPSLDPFQTTQRKMLLDPTTGNYYLVDTPVQPATKRLFDPETGQYVDVPMPQPPMTPVPMQVSPLALSPGAYGHTYMIYPGFMPSPSVIPARTLVQSQMSMQSDAESGEKVSSQQTEGRYMESPFYMATGKSSQATSGTQQQQQQPAAGRMPQGFSSVKQPVISITSQQGPRIIAPPSFDGTTMSFVVEHR